MSASKIIEQIKRLSPDERAEVLAFVRALPDEDTSSEVRYISNASFAEVAPQVFARHRELMRKLAQ